VGVAWNESCREQANGNKITKGTRTEKRFDDKISLHFLSKTFSVVYFLLLDKEAAWTEEARKL